VLERESDLLESCLVVGTDGRDRSQPGSDLRPPGCDEFQRAIWSEVLPSECLRQMIALCVLTTTEVMQGSAPRNQLLGAAFMFGEHGGQLTIRASEQLRQIGVLKRAPWA